MESMNNFNTGLLSPSRISTPSKMLIPKQIKFEIGSKDWYYEISSDQYC